MLTSLRLGLLGFLMLAAGPMLEGQNPFRLPFAPQVVPERLTLEVNAFALAFAPDGKALATSKLDRTGWAINLLETVKGQELTSIPQQKGTSSVVFSPDGKALAVSSSEFRGKELVEKTLVDGTIIRSRNFDWPGVIHLWDTTTWRCPEPQFGSTAEGRESHLHRTGESWQLGPAGATKPRRPPLESCHRGVARSMKAEDDPSYVSAWLFRRTGNS